MHVAHRIEQVGLRPGDREELVARSTRRVDADLDAMSAARLLASDGDALEAHVSRALPGDDVGIDPAVGDRALHRAEEHRAKALAGRETRRVGPALAQASRA